MDLELRGKKAIVTGGSEGIGLATARTLYREGCGVVIVARRPDVLERAASLIRRDGGGEVATIIADLSTAEGVDAVARKAGDIDILVNNAGAIPPGDLLGLDEARWRQGWDLKVFGYINLSRALYSRLAARHGVIVNIIGAAGDRLPPDYIAGAVGNAALMALTRALGDAACKDNLRIVGVSPGPVDTQRLRSVLPAQAKARLGDEGRWPELVASMPFGRFAAPQEIADAVAFLASPRSGYTSGTVLSIHGGH